MDQVANTKTAPPPAVGGDAKSVGWALTGVTLVVLGVGVLVIRGTLGPQAGSNIEATAPIVPEVVIDPPTSTKPEVQVHYPETVDTTSPSDAATTGQATRPQQQPR